MEKAIIMLPSESNRDSKRRKKLQVDHQDLISALPLHMIQHILSFMPTIDAVRSSILSRTWLHAWNTLPVFTFNFSCQTHQFEESFPLVTKFNNNTISILTEREDMHVNFHISWPSFRKDSYKNCIDEWMRLVSAHHVRELKIDLLPKEKEEGESDEEENGNDEDEDENETYSLPYETLFSAAESLVVLKLRGCGMPMQLMQIKSINFASLRVLFWEYFLVSNNNNAVEDLLPLCPILEECTLISIRKRVQSILLSNHRKLKHVKLDGFIDVTLDNLPNLQVLDLSNFEYIDFGNDRNSCNGLRKLSLKTGEYTDYGNLQFCIYNLPSLESLAVNTDGTWPVSISNASIENFSFSSSMEPPKIEVDAPRLRCYEYRSSLLPATSFETNPFAIKRMDLVLTPHRGETLVILLLEEQPFGASCLQICFEANDQS